MSSQAADLSLEAATALLTHLREHPSDALLPAAELSERLGVNVDLLRTVLSEAHPPRSAPEAKPPSRPSLAWVPKVWAAAVHGFDRLIEHPKHFIGITSLIFFAQVLTLALIGMDGRVTAQTAHNATFVLRSPVTLLLFVIIFGGHMLCYFRRAMARYAVYGGLQVWVLSSLMMMPIAWVDFDSRSGEMAHAAVTFFVGVAMFVMAGMYTGLGGLFAVLGAWYRLRRQDRAAEQLTRQEMLERYFELQSKLEQGVDLDHTTWRDWRWVKLVTANTLGAAFVLGALSTSLHRLLDVVFHTMPLMLRPGSTPIAFVVLDLGITAATLAAWVTVTFLARGVWRAVVTSLCYSIGSSLIAFAVGGRAYMHDPRVAFAFTVGTVVFALAASVIGLGAIIQQRATRDMSLQRNDRATVLGEMLRIQWQLSENMTTVCVMVVDAAQSSTMKAESDPLAVEYSFRVYQAWIDEVCKGFGGKVHSTAGDGAVIAFSSCQLAFKAGQRLQSDLARFNRDFNRLALPFRLRIGLHTGPIVGNLDEVEFTEVIDIAAHVEGVAPIGGIALTESVAKELEGEMFAPINQKIDNQPVLLALFPQEG